jgi:hypothetical protein
MDVEKPVAEMAVPQEPVSPEPEPAVQAKLYPINGHRKSMRDEFLEQFFLLMAFYIFCFGVAYWLSLGWHAGAL